MLVDFKYNILKMQISDCMNSMEIQFFSPLFLVLVQLNPV